MEDDLNNDMARIDRRLSAQHQIYNTELMWRIKQQLDRHEQELIGLGVVVIALTMVILYDDYRIKVIGERTSKEPTTHL